MKNTVLFHTRYGKPEEVIKCELHPVRSPEKNEILVKTCFTPINPADLNLIEGKYGNKPPFPVIPGWDGAGIVEKIGSAVSSISVGAAVIIPRERSNWQTYRVVDADDVIPLPKSISLEQGAMLNVNPLTALCLLKQFVALKSGDWIVQNAANSGLGRSIIGLAKLMKINTLNIVRDPHYAEELKEAGADSVIIDGDELSKRIKSEVNGEAIKLAINSVGGENARHLARSLEIKGTMVTVGAMSKEPVIIDNGVLIFKEITVKGFWRSRWIQEASKTVIDDAYHEIVDYASKGAFKTPIVAVYPPKKIKEALKHSQESRLNGKILIGF